MSRIAAFFSFSLRLKKPAKSQFTAWAHTPRRMYKTYANVAPRIKKEGRDTQLVQRTNMPKVLFRLIEAGE